MGDVVDPDHAVFGFDVFGNLREPLLILAEVPGNAANREEVVDFVDLHDQAARAFGCRVQFQGISSSIRCAG